jgi:hypothetical protein
LKLLVLCEYVEKKFFESQVFVSCTVVSMEFGGGGGIAVAVVVVV